MRIGTLPLVIAITVACTPEPSAPDLLVRGESKEPEVETWRTRNMNLEVVVDGERVTLTDAQFTWELLTQHCELVIATGDTDHTSYDPDAPFLCEPDNSVFDTCLGNYCNAQQLLCMAHRALAFANAAKDEEADVVGYDVIVPPQDSETRALLASTAYLMAASASTTLSPLVQVIGGAVGTSSSLACADATLAELWSDLGGGSARPDLQRSDQSLKEAIVATMIEGHEVAVEAVELYEEQARAVTDADRGIDALSSASIAPIELSWLDPQLSRAAAAHLLVGGSRKGLHYSAEAGICTAESLTEGARSALRLLRESAIDPALIDSGYGIEAVIAGPNGEVESGLRERLIERRAEPALGGLSGEAFAAYWGLSLGDFRDAREYLKQEIRAFGRDRTAVAPPSIIGLSDVNDVAQISYTTTHNYAATLTEPVAPPEQYYVAITRFPAQWSEPEGMFDDLESRLVIHTPCTSNAQCLTGQLCADVNFGNERLCLNAAGAPILPPPHYGTQSIAHLTEHLATVARDVTLASAGTDSALPAPARNLLAARGVQLRREAPARVEGCYRSDTSAEAPDVFRLRLYGATDPSRVRVVRNTSGLRCAEDGNVEGVACNLDQYLVGGEATVNRALGPGFGFDGYVEVLVSLDMDDEHSGTEWLHIVELREGAPPGRPGSYRGVAVQRAQRMRDTLGFPTAPHWLPRAAPTPTAAYEDLVDVWTYCTVAPVAPEFSRRAAEILTPNSRDCSAPKTNCVGFDFAHRIPLENEIIRDGFDPESSWRHYLEEAKTAATYADELAKQLVEEGLAIDERIEDAEAELEASCGSATSIREAAWTNLENDINPPCGGTDECPSGRTCFGGLCIRDVEAELRDTTQPHTGAERLLQCISEEATTPLVSAGSNVLCVWENEYGLCGRPTDASWDLSCPYFLVERQGSPGPDADCQAIAAEKHLGPDEVDKVYAVGANLNLFDKVVVATNDVEHGETLDCSYLENFHQGVNVANSLAYVIEELQLDPASIQQAVAQIGWRALPDDYSEITLNDVPIFTTGYPITTTTLPVVNDGWPCGAYGPNAVTVGQCRMDVAGSMFDRCLASCSDNGQRADRIRMNYDMARAVMALKLAAGLPMSNVIAPFVPSSRFYTWLTDRDERHMAEACSDGSDCDFEKLKYSFVEVGAETLFGGRTLTVSKGIDFWVEESESDDSDQTFPHSDSQAYCNSGPTGNDEGPVTIWTSVTANDELIPLRPNCSQAGAEAGSGWSSVVRYRMPVIFRPMTDTVSDVPTAAAWWGGLTPGGGSPGKIHELLSGVPDTLYGVFVNKDTPAIDSAKRFTNLFNTTATLLEGRDGRTMPRCPDGEWNCRGGFAVEERNFNLVGVPPAAGQITARDFINGLQVMCEAKKRGSRTCADARELVPSTLEDLSVASKSIECSGEDIKRQAALTLLRNVPSDILPGQVTDSAFAGDRGDALANMVGAFNSLVVTQHEIGSVLVALAGDITVLRNQLKQTVVRRKLAENEAESQRWSQMSACVNAGLQAASYLSPVTVDPEKNPVLNTAGLLSASGQALVTCANSYKQISLAVERLNLTDQDFDFQDGTTWATFKVRFRDHADAMEALRLNIDTQLTLLKGALGALEGNRIAAQRLLHNATMATSDAVGRTYAVNAVLRARYNTTRKRYEEATTYAQRMAYLARRALEQRIGTDLFDMREDLAFVKAPHGWADSVCTFEGVKYEDIADASLSDYSTSFIGDYVRQLEQVKESYGVEFPFVEGTDTAVVSLRDDATMSRSVCPVSVNNLLRDSADLSTTAWSLTGCEGLPSDVPICETEEQEDCGDGSPIFVNCGTVARGDAEPVSVDHQVGEAVSSYTVSFGDPTGGSAPTSLVPGETAVEQEVVLSPGVYRLSWRAPVIDNEYDGSEAVSVLYTFTEEINGPSGVELLESTEEPLLSALYTLPSESGWPLHYFFFRLPEGAESFPTRIRVQSNPNDSSYHSLEVAAFMLEDVTQNIDWTRTQGADASLDPGSYFATTEPGVTLRPVCEDTYGDTFRAGWERGCTTLCPSGYDTCNDGRRQCFYERTFAFSLASIESQSSLSRAGFAYGNYNYRIDSLALNVVGTGVRDCGGSGFGSSCYGAGYVPISIYHEGSFDVRNHAGAVYSAPLYDGVVEHARALAAERYLTNPVSSADQQLIQPYVRAELAGRPLTGRFRIRIWDQDGLHFQRLEDVQVLLNYRYWTATR